MVRKVHIEQRNKSIEQKIVGIVLSVACIALAMLSIVIFSGMLHIKNTTVIASKQMGSKAAADSQKSIESQTVSKLLSISRNKSQILDASYRKLQDFVDIAADSATALYANPSAYPPVTIAPADPEKDGSVTVQFSTATGEEIAGTKAEVELLGNIGTLFLSIAENDNQVDTIYLATESGIMLAADKDAKIRAETPPHDVRVRPWYKQAVEQGSLIWTDLYEDGFNRGSVMTCSKPIFGPQGELVGVLAVDAKLSDLMQLIEKDTFNRTGYSFILDDDGRIIVSPAMQQDNYGNIIFENFSDNTDEDLIDTEARMIDGETGVNQIIYKDKAVYLAFCPMKTQCWSVATLIDVDEVLAPVQLSSDTLMSLSGDLEAQVTQSFFLIIALMFVVLVFVILVTILLGQALAKRLTKPISTLIDGVKQISGGDLDYKINIQTGDEIEDLSNAFNYMTEELQVYIRNLSKATTERERGSAQLNVAKKIQLSMLPTKFPPFPDRDEFEIFAQMLPAKAVGGDFYDFFLLDETHLAVVIADVAGKGVPAALFMVIAKTLIKNHMQLGISPDEAFDVVNKELCEHNLETGMFVTAFMGVLNTVTGEFFYVNAGHTPPLIYRKDEGYHWLPIKKSLFLAGLEDTEYETDGIILRHGDRIFLYTDGVTESTNSNKEMFSKKRLFDIMNEEAMRNMPNDAILSAVRARLTAFEDGAEQVDDITMMIVEYNGNE